MPKKFIKKIDDSLQDQLFNAVNDFLENTPDLREQITDAWNEMQQPQKVHDSPEVWIWLTPTKLYFPPWKISNNILSLRPAIEFTFREKIGEKPKVAPRSVPVLTIEEPPGDEINLAVPLPISYSTLEDEFMKGLLEEEIDITSSFLYKTLKINDVEIYPSGETIVVGVSFDVTGIIPALDASGRIFLSTALDYDSEGKILHYDNLSFSRDIPNKFASYLVWLVYNQLHKPIKDNASYDWGEQEKQVLAQANQQLALLDEDDFDVEAQIKSINFSNIYLLEDYLLLYAYVDGKVNASLRSKSE